jgi:GT2 family glycosyltransferase
MSITYQTYDNNITISFVILSWNSAKYLQRCFDSIIYKCLNEHIIFEVIIIDNGSSDLSCEIISDYQKRYPEYFKLIKLDSNKGTTSTRNMGLKQSRGRFICILDSDIELKKGSLTAVFNRFTSDNNIGMIVPQLLLPDGSVQNSVKHFPTLYNKLLKIPRIIMGIKTKHRDFYDDFPFIEERNVDTAISACWFFRRELLHSVGYLDENIFYSPEDLDYSLRVWKKGKIILYYPDFVLVHHTQQITHKKPFSKTSVSHFLGLIYYFCKHGGWVVRPRF